MTAADQPPAELRAAAKKLSPSPGTVRAVIVRNEDDCGERDRLRAALLHFAAEAHRRKWSHEGTAAFDVLHRLGNELRAALDEPAKERG